MVDSPFFSDSSLAQRCLENHCAKSTIFGKCWQICVASLYSRCTAVAQLLYNGYTTAVQRDTQNQSFLMVFGQNRLYLVNFGKFLRPRCTAVLQLLYNGYTTGHPKSKFFGDFWPNLANFGKWPRCTAVVQPLYSRCTAVVQQIPQISTNSSENI